MKYDLTNKMFYPIYLDYLRNKFPHFDLKGVYLVQRMNEYNGWAINCTDVKYPKVTYSLYISDEEMEDTLGTQIDKLLDLVNKYDSHNLDSSECSHAEKYLNIISPSLQFYVCKKCHKEIRQ